MSESELDLTKHCAAGQAVDGMVGIAVQSYDAVQLTGRTLDQLISRKVQVKIAFPAIDRIVICERCHGQCGYGRHSNGDGYTITPLNCDNPALRKLLGRRRYRLDKLKPLIDQL